MNLPSLSILQIITQRRFSGAERICLVICSELMRRGHRVRLLCKPDKEFVAAAQARRIDVHTPGISGKLNIAAPFRIASHARDMGADLIHTHLSTATLMGSLAGKCIGIPVVGHVHALNTWQNFMLCSRLISCSAGVARHMISQGAPPENVRIALNGIETDRFSVIPSQDDCRRSLGIPEGAPVIACVAHLSAKKGHEYLIRAIAELSPAWPTLQCLLAGEGELKEPLTELSASLGIASRVHFLGYREDVMEIVNACDVAVLSSIAKEGLGLVLVEAALLGKPVVASNAPGIDEAVLNGETGVLVPPGDTSALATALNQLLSDPALRQRMGTAGKARALETFSVKSMTDRIEEVYREVINKVSCEVSRHH